MKHAVRIPSNDSLERDIAELLTWPVGRPSQKPVVWYKSFLCQADSWKTARRLVAKVEFHFGELFPRVGFIVTSLETDNRRVVWFYNKRGTAEQWITAEQCIQEGKQAGKTTRLSCPRFRSNEVRFWVSALAYNPGNLWRCLVLPERIDNRSPTSLQQWLEKTGGRLIEHARYHWLLLAESHPTRWLFGAMVKRIAALRGGRRLPEEKCDSQDPRMRFGLYRRGPGNPKWEFRFKQNCHNASSAKEPGDPTLSGSDSEIMHKYRKTWRGQECHSGAGSSCRG